jgi:hypothetical protein
MSCSGSTPPDRSPRARAAPPDLEDLGQCSVAIKRMGVEGPKFMEDERATQDLILVSPASFVTPNIRENAKLQRKPLPPASTRIPVHPGENYLRDAMVRTLDDQDWTFDSDAQLAFADVLRYNPWHSLPEHKPLGNSRSCASR